MLNKNTIVCSVALLLLMASPSRAGECNKLPRVGELGIPACVLSVYDGDTMTVRAQPWPDLMIHARVRLAGIDAPENDGKCRNEIQWAASSTNKLMKLAGDMVWLRRIKHDRYGGRVVAEVYTKEGEDIAAKMLETAHARPYTKGQRLSWCPPGEGGNDG